MYVIIIHYGSFEDLFYGNRMLYKGPNQGMLYPYI